MNQVIKTRARDDRLVAQVGSHIRDDIAKNCGCLPSGESLTLH